jgi:hypothetical protein
MNNLRILLHLKAYAEHQVGERVPGIDYRQRADGERLNNWSADIGILHNINKSLNNIYRHDNSSTISDDTMFPYLEQSLNILNAMNQVSSLNDHQKNYLLQELYNTERNLAMVAINRRQFDLSDGHCQRGLAYSKMGPINENKTYSIFAALQTYCYLRERQGNLSDALNYAEEGYNLVVEAYDPVHPQVQEAAGVLINILTVKGDFYNAERFAQVTYENLQDKKNGMNQEGEEAARGGHNLAKVILLQKGDLKKAEKLARESLRIRNQLHSSDYYKVADSCTLLANILKAQDNFGDETKGLYERSLDISIGYGEPGGAAVGNGNIALFYYKLAEKSSTADVKLTQLNLAKSYYEETVRILAKTHGLNHSKTVKFKSLLAEVLGGIVYIKNLDEDENLLFECKFESNFR